MNKTLAAALLSGIIGFAAGNAFWYLASPLWIDVVVSEKAPATEASRTLKSGSFRDADSVHRGKGRATILDAGDGRRIARFTDFQVTNGPDLEVWLVAKGGIQNSGDVTSSAYVSLGRLKGNIGDQNYDIPADVDLENYASIVIWCEQFGVLFSAADLKGGETA
jgi:hypothetical protein